MVVDGVRAEKLKRWNAERCVMFAPAFMSVIYGNTLPTLALHQARPHLPPPIPAKAQTPEVGMPARMGFN
jgi:hypothetical protein